MAEATERRSLQVGADEQAARAAVADALTRHGATIVRNEPGALVAHSGSAGKTVLYGALVGVESFPLAITVSLAPSGAGTSVEVVVEPRGIGRMAGGLFSSIVVPLRGGKAAQAWMERTIGALGGGAPAVAATPGAAPQASPSQVAAAVAPPSGPTVPSGAPPPAAEPPPQPVMGGFCSTCGARMPVEARFCPQCGTQRPA